MKPGATTRSAASITVAAPSVTRPISAIVPPEIATSARRAGAPVPSTSMPFLITRSWAMTSSSSDVYSLDDLIRSPQQRIRDRQAERLRGPRVDHELEFFRPLDRQLGGLGAAQDLSDVDATAAESLTQIRSEEHTSELQSLTNLVCRLLLEKKKYAITIKLDAVLAVVSNLSTQVDAGTVNAAGRLLVGVPSGRTPAACLGRISLFTDMATER